MKKLFLILAVMIANVNAAFGQDTFVATLEHNGEYRNFYNTTALTAAYEAAQDGDVITLSSGTFLCPTIAKSVTIRGIGLGQLIKNDRKTIISNALEVYAPNSSCVVNLEGLYLNRTMDIYSDGSTETAGKVNIIMTRCGDVNVKEKNSPTAETTPEVCFYNCRMIGEFKTSESSYTNVKVLNSCIYGRCYTKLSEVSNTTFKNCYMTNGYLNDLEYLVLENCILYQSNTQYLLPSSVSAINSVCLMQSGIGITSIFNNVLNQENCSIIKSVPSDLSTIFSDTQNFILNEEFAQKYLGTDGTQVGMRGGIGYTTKMLYPVISKMEISNNQTTTRDGKLDITIELDNE